MESDNKQVAQQGVANDISGASYVPVNSRPRAYSYGQIIAATIIGGPFAGVYMMSENFKALNKIKLADKTMQIGIGLSALLLLVLIILPDDFAARIPTLTVPIAYTIAIGFAVREYQGEELKDSIKRLATIKHSIWRVLGVSLLALVISFAYMLVLALIFGLLLG